MPPTAPSTMFRIPGRIPANDLNTNQIGNYMRSVYHNLAMTHGANVMSAKLKQKVAYRDILGRESLLRRRQEQLSNLSDQIAQYYGEFGSVLNDRALDFLNKQANINVPTFTSILAGFENARASRADMEQKRLRELERLMNLDAGLQQERMALRKEQMDAQNMVAQAALDAQSKMSAGQIDAAKIGLNALSHSGTGVTFDGGSYVSAPYQQQPRIPGLGGSAGAKAAAQAELLRRDIASSKQATTTETPAEKATGTPAQKSEPMKGDVMNEVFPTGNDLANSLKTRTGAIAKFVREGKPGFSGDTFQQDLADLRTYFGGNPDKLQIMDEYVPGFSERLKSDEITPKELDTYIREAWDKSAKVRQAARFPDLPTQDTTKATTAPVTQPSNETTRSSSWLGKFGPLGAAAGTVIDTVNMIMGSDEQEKQEKQEKQDNKETSSIIDVLSPTAVHAAESTAMTPEQIALANAGGVPREGRGGETVLQDADARAMSKNTNGVPSNQTIGQTDVYPYGATKEEWDLLGEELRDEKSSHRLTNYEMQQRLTRIRTALRMAEDNRRLREQQERERQESERRFPSTVAGQEAQLRREREELGLRGNLGPSMQNPDWEGTGEFYPEMTSTAGENLTSQLTNFGNRIVSGLNAYGNTVAANINEPEEGMPYENPEPVQIPTNPSPRVPLEFGVAGSGYIPESLGPQSFQPSESYGPGGDPDLPPQVGANTNPYPDGYDMSLGDPNLPSKRSITQDDLYRMVGENPPVILPGTNTPPDEGVLYPTYPSTEDGLVQQAWNAIYPDAARIGREQQEVWSWEGPRGYKKDLEALKNSFANNPDAYYRTLGPMGAGVAAATSVANSMLGKNETPQNTPALPPVQRVRVAPETTPEEQVQAQAETETQGGYSASAEELGRMVGTPEYGAPSAPSMPIVPAAPATPAAPAQPNYDEFFDDVNNQRSMRPFGPAQAQAQAQAQVQPQTSINVSPLQTQGGYYGDPWYNPDVSRTIQVGTGAENTRVPMRVAAGRLPGDNRIVRLTDANGNFYDIPASMLGQAQQQQALRRGYDDWTVLSPQDRALRDANQLDINLIEDAFTRMYANAMANPGAGQWYPLPGNQWQNNLAPQYYPAQERQPGAISPEVKAVLEAKSSGGIPLSPVEGTHQNLDVYKFSGGQTGWDGMHSLSKDRINKFAAIAAQHGVRVPLVTLFRDQTFQADLYDRNVTQRKRKGQKPYQTAKPGWSNHQGGLAFDTDVNIIGNAINNNPQLRDYAIQRYGRQYGRNNAYLGLIDEWLGQAGLYRPMKSKDPSHVELIQDQEYFGRVDHARYMADRGRWNGAAAYEIGQSAPPKMTQTQVKQAQARTTGQKPLNKGMSVNNPFNLRLIEYTRPGEIKNTRKDFQGFGAFKDLMSGVTAGVHSVIARNIIGRNTDTIRKFVNTYLGVDPRTGTNSTNDNPEQYMRNLEQATGLSRDQQIDITNEELMLRLLGMVAQTETGSRNYIGVDNLRTAYRKVMNDIGKKINTVQRRGGQTAPITREQVMRDARRMPV